VLPDIVLNSSSIAASAALVEVCALPSAILVLFSFRAVDYAVLLYLRIRRIVRRILYPGRMSFFAAGSCCVGEWRRAVERVRGRDAAGDDQRRCCNVVYNYVRGRRPYEGLTGRTRPCCKLLQVNTWPVCPAPPPPSRLYTQRVRAALNLLFIVAFICVSGFPPSVILRPARWRVYT